MKSCLEGGHKEFLYFFINDKALDDGSCALSTLIINVVQTVCIHHLALIKTDYHELDLVEIKRCISFQVR